MTWWLNPDPPDADEDERAAVRTAWFLACSVGALVVGLVTVVAIIGVQDRHLREANAGGGGGEVVAAAEEIGPRPGASVATYLRDRGEALAAATGDRAAVVSLEDYVSEAEARALAEGAGVEVDGFLAAVPDAPPEAVEGRLTAWVEEKREDVEQERRELERLLPTVEEADFRREFEAEIARLGDRLERLTPEADLVFGLVVRGPADKLRALAEDAAVRLVDPAGGAAVPDRYAGLRPEERARAGEPAMRPLDG